MLEINSNKKINILIFKRRSKTIRRGEYNLFAVLFIKQKQMLDANPNK